MSTITADRIADHIIESHTALSLRVLDGVASSADIGVIAGTMGTHDLLSVDMICDAIRGAFMER